MSAAAAMSPVPMVAQFLETYRQEHATTMRVLKAIPPDQLAFKPHEKSMSCGELAWHVAYSPLGIAKAIAAGDFGVYQQPPTPNDLQAIVAGAETYYNLACETVAKFTPETLQGNIPIPNGQKLPSAAFFWVNLFHLIHHRGQLVLMTRLAGGTPPGMYGPNREAMQKMKEAMQAQR